MIPLWYGGMLALACAYFGFWYGRSRNWGLLETNVRMETENRSAGGRRSDGGGNAGRQGREGRGGTDRGNAERYKAKKHKDNCAAMRLNIETTSKEE